MTNGREQPHEWAEREVIDHEVELDEHQSRLEELEDRLNRALPVADTPRGGAQRAFFEVPTPASVFAIGARGMQAASGRPVGPGGFGLETEANLGAHVGGSTCIDTDGLTIVHSVGPARWLTQADLGIASIGPLRIGTRDGDVEISAGSVPAPDPAFTVIPSQPIPRPPNVDTEAPRSATERVRHGWTSLWHTARQIAWLFEKGAAASTVTTAPSHAPRAMRAVQARLRDLASLHQVFATAWAVAEGLSMVFDEEPLQGPEVRIHGDGGVTIETRGHAEMYGHLKSACTSPIKAEVRGGVSAGVYSAGQASCFGMLGAKLKSEGVAEVSARFVAVKATHAELQGRRAVAITSGSHVLVDAFDYVHVEAPDITMACDHVEVGANRSASIAAERVSTHATQTNTVKSDRGVQVEAGRQIELKVDRVSMRVQNDRVVVNPGGRHALRVTRGTLEYGTVVRVTSHGTTIRGHVDLG